MEMLYWVVVETGDTGFDYKTSNVEMLCADTLIMTTS